MIPTVTGFYWARVGSSPWTVVFLFISREISWSPVHYGDSGQLGVMSEIREWGPRLDPPADTRFPAREWPLALKDPPLMKPTVGRIVHYYSDDMGSPHAAIITQVWGDDCVNLHILGNYNKPGHWDESSVSHSDDPTAGMWSWPPREGQDRTPSEIETRALLLLEYGLSIYDEWKGTSGDRAKAAGHANRVRAFLEPLDPTGHL